MPTASRHAWQSWRHARSVFALAAAALAVGIGATTAIYTVVNAVMLQAARLPARRTVRSTVRRDDRRARGPLLTQLRGRRRSTRLRRRASTSSVGSGRRPTPSRRPGAPQHVQGAAVTTSLAHNLGRSAGLGQLVHRRHGGGHLERPVAAARRQSVDPRQPHGPERPLLHDHRRHAAAVPAAGDRTRRRQRPQRRLDRARSHRHRARLARRRFLLRLRAAQAGRHLRPGGRRRQAGRRRYRPEGSRPRILAYTGAARLACARWW